jgi:hypothetical protein
MSDFLKSFLIELVLGFIAAVAICFLQGVHTTENTLDTIRILSDGFFAAAAIFLVSGGITFCTNGGAFDGLGFSAKIMLDRMRSDYEERRITFAQYQERRREKAKSPKSSFLVGLILLFIATAFLIAFNTTI